MKNFNYQTVEVLSNEELAAVKGGIGIPTPIIITGLAATSIARHGNCNLVLSLSHGAAEGKHEIHKK